jgi:RNA polymerase sigma-70 factor (ECF subfamily)
MDLIGLINLYRGPLIGLIASWGAPWADATEIAQDSFADAWLKRAACRGDGNEPEVFGRWLRGVARNHYRNWSRSKRRRERAVTLSCVDLEQVVAPADLEHSERLESLREAIARLPTRQRQVVLMHYLEETSVKEIAVLLSVTATTVEGRLYQARRTLHRQLGSPLAPTIRKLLLCL